MASCDVLERDHWPTLYLPYAMDILKLFYKAHNETLPELLSKNSYSKRSNGYSLRRDDSQFKKILDIWKIPLPIEVQSCGNEPEFSHRNQNERCNWLKTKTYFRDFKFNVVSASVVRRWLYFIIYFIIDFILLYTYWEILTKKLCRKFSYKFQLCFLPRPVSTEEPAPEIAANLPRGAPTAISGPRDRKNGRENPDQWWYSARPLVPSYAF